MQKSWKTNFSQGRIAEAVTGLVCSSRAHPEELEDELLSGTHCRSSSRIGVQQQRWEGEQRSVDGFVDDCQRVPSKSVDVIY